MVREPGNKVCKSAMVEFGVYRCGSPDKFRLDASIKEFPMNVLEAFAKMFTMSPSASGSGYGVVGVLGEKVHG
eukprot:2166713-Amphidinium_carterae.1